jgi:sRNA-binding protein
MMQARQKEAAKLAAEARKSAFEAAKKEAAEKEAAEKEAAKLRDATASQPSPNSQNNTEGTPSLLICKLNICSSVYCYSEVLVLIVIITGI